MNDHRLPDEVLGLIRNCVPTLDALEVFVFFGRHRERSWTTPEVVEAIQPAIIRDPPIHDVLGLLVAHGVLADTSGRLAYNPRSPAVAGACDGLLVAYNERPVTLIRTLHDIADSKTIQAFADAFRIRKDP